MTISKSMAAALLGALFAMGAAVGCGGRTPFGDHRDCFATGSCECRDTADCPEGLICINGRCGNFADGSVTRLGFGERCEEDSECESERCVPNAHATFNVCTRTCEGDCPPGWACNVRPGATPESLCVQFVSRLCAECSVDDHCHPAFGDYCLTLDGIQGCGRDCTWESCPEGYACQSVTVAGGAVQQCVPTQGSCRCTPEAVGLVRSCAVTNAYGTCHGESTCQASGEWSPCDASEPAAEKCNGLDDNCNGLIDGDDPAVDISTLPTSPPYPECRTGAAGACEGRWSCRETTADLFAWVCDAVDPVDEVCDGRDNDCDGTVDEDFLNADGQYLHPNACGSCALDCEAVVANLALDPQGEVLDGAVTCELRNGAPTCVPQLCADGFAPYPEQTPVLCLELVSPQCQPCTSNVDCLLSVDECRPVGADPHDSCLQGCGTDAFYGGCTGQVGAQGCCPDDSTCEQVDGMLLCVPTAGSCDCDADRVGSTRPCFITEGAATCIGLETCEAQPNNVFGWSECDASETVVEVCDGVDNDCNGEIDDPFFDTQGSGTYDVDEHCGACNVNCLAMWSQEIQHAIGGCTWQPGDAPDCEIVDCTTEVVGGGGTCQLDADCNAGWSCHPSYHQCARPCTGPADCPGGTCAGTWCTASCSSNPDCENQFGPPSACVGGLCQVEYQWHDVDEVESNGCECAASNPPAGDAPDLYDTYPEAGWPNVDRNCDGVDGNLQNALFVWSGTDASQGTREHPFMTIDEALSVFVPGQHSQILVAAGYYEETLILTAGMQLYGGYSPDFAERDVVLYPTIVAGPEPNYNHPNHPRGVINAVDISGVRTVVAGFVIYGFDVTYQPPAGNDGESTYAVYLRNCSSSVVIANNVIVGGRGGDGGLGTAGSPGGAGGDGGDGLNSTECNTAQCYGESQPGGGGGSNGGCSGAVGNGGAPANGDLETQGYSGGGLNGAGGDNGTYSNANNPDWWYLCKYDCVVGQDMDGNDAQSGGNGTTGGGGSGCGNSLGTITGGVWNGGTGAYGTAGAAGQGGGGGGAGGCVRNSNGANCNTGNLLGDLGSTGGGGGAGGCGGTGGAGGGSGGASFGVFVAYTYAVATRPQVFGNVIERGEGGAGGAGGYGGHGGLGGQGGTGGIAFPPAWCAGYGGKGGRGGDGGGGGGGGGGCGGVAFGVAGQQIGSAGYGGTNAFAPPASVDTGGPGGAGGPSPSGGSANGSAGIAGDSGDVNAY